VIKSFLYDILHTNLFLTLSIFAFILTMMKGGGGVEGKEENERLRRKGRLYCRDG
jgi:hypothetical protein